MHAMGQGTGSLTPMGPARLMLIRHAESAGNLADLDARRRGASRLELAQRDADVPLSPTGVEQADAIGRYLAQLPRDQTPTAVVSSPYVRSADTAHRALAASGMVLRVITDERLRERELGVFDGLTSAGVRSEFPEEAKRRDRLGKFYYRPPGGESWADVVLRLRSFFRDTAGYPSTSRLWIFTHQAVIACCRYLLEGLTEADILDLDRRLPVPNGSMTTYHRSAEGSAVLGEYAATTAMESAGAPRTREPEHAGRGDEP